MQPGDVYETGFDESTGKTTSESATCPECDGHVVTDGGERHCPDCGLVIDEYHIDHGATARKGPGDERDPRHIGSPRTPARHDYGLTTEIGRTRDGTGRTLDGKTRQRFSRLRVQHRRARHESKRDRNLEQGCQEVSRIAGALGLSRSLEEQAAMVFRRAQDEHLLRGRSIEAVAAASVHAACRCAGLPRSISEIEPLARVAGQRVRNAYRVLNDELGLPTPPPTPTAFVPKYASALEVSTAIRKRALELAELAVERGVASGRQPSGVAAACLYQASLEAGAGLVQTTLADLADVTPTTIRTGWNAVLAAIDATDGADSATADAGGTASPVPGER
ncbi:transcription initiation factor IIB [Haloplanus pelagicus]|jgi:transcription initiation factor TFIIB|uniref:transcription initiation factor IIB n=1 Tax=Haloplanus pelagicus TaxID=2949995 RepID=UPI00203B9133|nr:TFIIB-type zinc ribbon-containing protein [Haloplanus sp. HW8-1]